MMKICITIIAIAMLLFGFAACSASSIVDSNNASFSSAVNAITADTTVLQDIIPFEWDVTYTFTPYMPKENIEEIIGFTSDYIEETSSENLTQLLFVKDEIIICSICAHPDYLGQRPL